MIDVFLCCDALCECGVVSTRTTRGSRVGPGCIVVSCVRCGAGGRAPRARAWEACCCSVLGSRVCCVAVGCRLSRRTVVWDGTFDSERNTRHENRNNIKTKITTGRGPDRAAAPRRAAAAAPRHTPGARRHARHIARRAAHTTRRLPFCCALRARAYNLLSTILSYNKHSHNK